ncbi:MAG TPA: VanZ family protein [Vicinamibacterales bacterium]
MPVLTRVLWWWGPVVFYMAVLWVLSSQSALPGASLTPDWAQHGVGYAGLAVVTLRATARGQWARVGARPMLAAWLITVAYGMIDEWHQSFVPARMADPADVAADAIGAAAGLAAVWAWGIIRR